MLPSHKAQKRPKGRRWPGPWRRHRAAGPRRVNKVGPPDSRCASAIRQQRGRGLETWAAGLEDIGRQVLGHCESITDGESVAAEGLDGLWRLGLGGPTCSFRCRFWELCAVKLCVNPKAHVTHIPRRLGALPCGDPHLHVLDLLKFPKAGGRVQLASVYAGGRQQNIAPERERGQIEGGGGGGLFRIYHLYSEASHTQVDPECKVVRPSR